MTSMTDFTIIRRSLAARLPSTIITVLLVGTSVALLLVLLGLRDAGRRAFEQGPGNMHMLVSADASPLVAVLNGVFYANAPRAPIPWATYERIRSTLPLEYAIPVVQGDSYRGIRVLATTDAFFSAFRPRQDADWVVAEGRIFARPFEVVLGARAAAASGLAIGDRIALSHGIDSIAHPDDTVRAADVHDDHAHDDHDHDDHAHDDHGHDDHAHDDHGHDDEHDHNHAGPGHLHAEFRFEVVGILAPTGGPHDRALFTDITSSWILHAHDRRVKDGFETTTADDLTEADRLITGIYVRVLTREGRMMSGAQQQVFDQLRRDPTLTVADPAQEIGRLFEIVGHIDDILLAMAAAVMGSSGFAILLALYNSMAQRRRQIAVLRVLGASRRRIFGLVLTESALLGWFGVIVGVVASWAGAAVVAGALRARLGLVVEPSMDLRSTLLVGIGTIVLAVVAGFAPAIMAYRTAVVEHLRPLD